MNKNTFSFIITKTFFLVFLLLLLSFKSKSQNQDVIIIDTYKPVISDAFKINENPQITDTAVEKIDLIYQVSPAYYPLSYTLNPIKPAKLSGQPLSKLYKSYLKVGFGSNITPLAEFSIGNTRSAKQSIGFIYRHFSSSGKIKEYGYPGFSDNEASFYVKKFYKNHTFSTDIDFARNVIHYYGFLADQHSDITKDSTRQRFNKIGATLNYKSNYIDSSRLNHNVAFNFYSLSDLFKSMENHFGLNASINKNVSLLGKTIKNQNLGINSIIHFYNNRNLIDTSNNGMLNLFPHFSANYDLIQFTLGLNTFFEFSDNSKIHFLPSIHFNLNLYNRIFVVYGGLTNNLERNNIDKIYKENPFINTSLPLEFSYTKSKFYGGFKGSISSNLSFNASVSKSVIDQLPLFYNDTTAELLNKFLVLYDKVGVFNTHFDITFQKKEKIKLLLASNYYQYFTEKEQNAWYKPTMDVQLLTQYNLMDKFILKADIIAYNGVDAKFIYSNNPVSTKIIHLKGTTDVNLGVEYCYSKILSAFLNFNNITSSKYKQWIKYPTYGFNILGGISYSF